MWKWKKNGRNLSWKIWSTDSVLSQVHLNFQICCLSYYYDNSINFKNITVITMNYNTKKKKSSFYFIDMSRVWIKDPAMACVINVEWKIAEMDNDKHVFAVYWRSCRVRLCWARLVIFTGKNFCSIWCSNSSLA